MKKLCCTLLAMPLPPVPYQHTVLGMTQYSGEWICVPSWKEVVKECLLDFMCSCLVCAKVSQLLLCPAITSIPCLQPVHVHVAMLYEQLH